MKVKNKYSSPDLPISIISFFEYRTKRNDKSK
nr:MAG TPA: hypothetical protein [Caudoviricetes sp.]